MLQKNDARLIRRAFSAQMDSGNVLTLKRNVGLAGKPKTVAVRL